MCNSQKENSLIIMVENALNRRTFLSLLAMGVAVSALPVAAQTTSPRTVARPLIDEGKPNAIIITTTRPVAGVQYAAQELAYHLEKATGVKLPIVSEDEVPADATNKFHIYLGDTRATRAAGINASRLALETFVLRTGDNALYIAGKDAAGDPLDRDTPAGTLFGVYEWLERDLGVRWVWPGELGTYVPKVKTVRAQAFDATIAPRFFQRHVRAGLSFREQVQNKALCFTPSAEAEYAQAQTVYLRRNRMGRSERMTYGHAFTDWWDKYGAEHPEWFQLVNGKRGPATPGARYSMCVSNPGLHQKIVELWREKGGAKPNAGVTYINAVENDILGLCECENCKAWDGPQPPDKDKFYAPNFKVYGSRFVSDRYAKFEKAIYDLASKENPDVRVVGYVYFNYFQAPTSGVKLNENILLGYCPSAGWYPRMDDENEWYQNQWQGWGDAGAHLFMRTNYFLDGYGMPFIFAHQFADDFQHAARNGMVGTDFDSLTGQWSTQGPNLYLLMRLHNRPDAKADDLLAEYYSAFGPAATQVKEYFDYWEKYTMDNRPLINKSFEDRVAIRWRSWAKATHKVFPPEVFAPAEAILARAANAAKNDAEARARVEFLQNGLTHAKMSAHVSSLLTSADPESTPERGKKELEQLLTFRRAHEKEWLANLNHNAWVEDVSWKLSGETRQEPEYYP